MPISTASETLASARTVFHRLVNAASERLAAELLNSGSSGIVFPCMRRRGGNCIACFRPVLVTHVRRAGTFRFVFPNSTTFPPIQVIWSTRRARRPMLHRYMPHELPTHHSCRPRQQLLVRAIFPPGISDRGKPICHLTSRLANHFADASASFQKNWTQADRDTTICPIGRHLDAGLRKRDWSTVTLSYKSLVSMRPK